jgi:hypothetical protein
LSNKKETITLLNLHSDTIVSFTYYDSIPGLEAADGLGRTLELHPGSTNLNDPASWFTGCIGGSPGNPYQACEESIIFSEINYNSATNADAGDWVELLNVSDQPVDISGWRFSDSENLHVFVIPDGTVLQSGAFLVLYGEKAKFESLFPLVTNKTGPFGFGLSGSGEAIRLFDKNGQIRFSVVYNDDPPWPKEPDGSGYTLELADIHGNMCDGLNWFAGCLGGSPGKVYGFPCYTSIDEFADNSFAVFPNPASTYLTIIQNKNATDKATVSICDALGRLLLEKQLYFGNSTSTRMTLDGIKDGVYLMRINTGNNKPQQVVRIVVAK